MLEILSALIVATTREPPPQERKSDDGLIALIALSIAVVVAVSQKKESSTPPQEKTFVNTPQEIAATPEMVITHPMPETQTPPNIASDDPISWVDHAVNYGCVLVWGGQNGGKTTAASQIISRRQQRGDRVIVLDPHAELGQWEGLEVIGAGMDYNAIDKFMGWYFTECQQRYKLLRLEGREAVKKLGSICLVAEELTNYSGRCKNSGEFIKACLSDNRKIFLNCVFISHNRTLATLGNAKGMAQTRDDSFLELHCIPPSGGSPRRWEIKYPGGDFQPIEVPNWETIHDFSNQTEQIETDRQRLERYWQMEAITSDPSISTAQTEPLNQASEPLNQPTDKDKGETEQRFTPLKLTRSQAISIINQLRTELNQTQVIERLWQVKKGGSAGWKEAYAQFKELMGDFGNEQT